MGEHRESGATDRSDDAHPDAETRVDVDDTDGGDRTGHVDRDRTADRLDGPDRRGTRPTVSRNGGSPAVDDVPTERTNGHDASPDDDASNGSSTGPVADPAEESLRASLGSGESLQFLREGTLLGDYRGPATVGVTDERLVVVTDAGEFVSVGLDRVSSVRSNPRSTVDVHGMDARLLFAVGYLLAVVGFLGVLAGSTSALTPALTLVALGGLVTLDRVRRDGSAAVAALDVGIDRDVDAVVPDPVVDRIAAAGDSVQRFDGVQNASGRLWAVGILAASPIVVILLLEAGIVVPFFALLTVGSIGLVVYAFRRGDSFDGVEFDWRRERTVTACLDDGRSVTVRTDVGSGLDRELATDVLAESGSRRSEVGEPR